MNLNFEKSPDGLLPAIVQDADSHAVLMLGYVNGEAVDLTVSTGNVTFFSRSRKAIWIKGETSGNYLKLVSIVADCDSDTILIRARPAGPTCHTGSTTCFGEPEADTITELEAVIADRRANPSDDSYVSSLFKKGINKIAQKVGEEAVETVIAAKDEDLDSFKAEAADLLFHYLILLNAKEVSLKDIADELKARRR
ncbi:MAG: bifunctional phosphoribosyl-AMP cyclohydrolase/phosphoribosyl-ATP diphosphatase HisIE [Pyrinomonadaceae bacterium]|nr:bifunctional phosphoribosyl-AMP cyclohydrolase/phosphoribosyl-ATP diphosphatase HisIE [Pyrinomonadaceae bacterium]